MNEKAIQAVISEYAMEVANLRLTVATLQQEKEQLAIELEVLKGKNNETTQEEK